MATAEDPSFEVPSSVLSRQVDEQMVLLNLATEEYFGLDEVGANILNRVTGQPFHEAVSALARDYDVDPEVLKCDVLRLIDQLLDAGLLVRSHLLGRDGVVSKGC